MRILFAAAFLSFGLIAPDVLLFESAAAQGEFLSQSTTEANVRGDERQGERSAESPITADQLRAFKNTTAADGSDPRPQGAEKGSRRGTAQAARSLPENHSAEYMSLEQLCNAVVVAAKAYELPLAFFANLIWQESRFNPHAVSRAGAEGIAQFMPATATRSGLADPFDPLQAIPASAQLLRQLKRQFGNWGLAAASYNSGPKRVNDWLAKRTELPRETRSYVSTIDNHGLLRRAMAQQPSAD
jgi:soluble lytic murein transglycosylase-like protein